MTILAVLLALILGGLLIAMTDKVVGTTASYFFARPSDFLTAVWSAATELLRRALPGRGLQPPRATASAGQFAPLMETLTIATPLITAGLGVALAFRAGLFNIGAQGQIIMAGILASWVGFALHLPLGLHLLLVLVAGVVGGAVWGGIVGVLKARTGAHEVIVTIMFNYIALYFLRYLLDTDLFQRPGADTPISPDPGPQRRVPADLRQPVPAAPGLPAGHRGHRVRLVAAEPLHARFRIPRRRGQPQGGPDRRHQRLPGHHPGDDHRRWPGRPGRRRRRWRAPKRS